MKSKILIYFLLSVVSIFISIAFAGIYKFNILQDEIYYDTSAITSEDIAFFIGSWVEPIPGNPNAVQGFTLNEDGTASSINMNTLLYQKWALKKGRLILTAKSIGNHSSSLDDMIYSIQLNGKNTLKLNNGYADFTYTRQ